MAQSGAPDWSLTVWSWEKAKLVATVRIGNERGNAIHHVSWPLDRTTTRDRVSQCVFVPPRDASVCVAGPRFFKQFRLTESSLRQQPHLLTKQNYDYRCIDWTQEDLLVGCAEGDILRCEGSEVIWSYRLEDGESAESIARSSNV